MARINNNSLLVTMPDDIPAGWYHDQLRKIHEDHLKSDDEHAGKIVSFPVGDGMASYVVTSSKRGLCMRHIDILDGHVQHWAILRQLRVDHLGLYAWSPGQAHPPMSETV